MSWVPAGSASRAAASVSPARAAITSSYGSSWPGTARQTGGIAAARARKVTASGPCTTGRHRATAPSPSWSSVGSTRPRATSSVANVATPARKSIEVPYRMPGARCGRAASAEGA